MVILLAEMQTRKLILFSNFHPLHFTVEHERVKVMENMPSALAPTALNSRTSAGDSYCGPAVIA